MKFLIFILQFIFIYGFFFLGQLLCELFSIPLPGSIIGFMLMFAALSLKLFPLRFVESTATLLLSFLPLYFIPATVGVIEYFDVFAGKGFFLIAVVIISTLLTMAASGLTSQYLGRRIESRKEQE
ncbi:CidA/LrgA family protein [Planomicrobium sp. Y74]|uniref:CidA/LrgA family protein n=1 Tax=Planomicrobium sp. Y74 TaxID=2478977 RepID=UPI000EF50874|nr:CidA/LrgA family protein [Planomicrobium sp. Y74]RLQ90963.1 CidA/LrgA family protein [Planomicrobium sp. Y74]